MKHRCRIAGLASLLVVFVITLPGAYANPSFARQYELGCSSCHTVWPNLNDYGRAFKENGFRVDAGSATADHLVELDDNLWTEKLSFLSAKVNGRLYDKKDTDEEYRLRAFHEIELYLAGNASNNFSFLVIAEAEDEPVEVTVTDDAGDTSTVVTDDAFNVFVDTGVVGWHPKERANLLVGWGSILSADPYNSLADGNRRLTRSHKAPLDMSFGSSFSLRKPTQFATFYGREDDLYYSASIGAGNDDPEGTDDKDYALRVAYDFPVVSVGGLYLDGTNRDGLAAGLDQDFMRAGVDFQVEVERFSAYGLYVQAEDDVVGGGDATNDAFYVEALYTIERQDQPWLYPLVRWEDFETNDGRDSTTAVIGLLGWFVRPNITLSLEHWRETSVPGAGKKNDRTTLFFNIGL